MPAEHPYSLVKVPLRSPELRAFESPWRPAFGGTPPTVKSPKRSARPASQAVRLPESQLLTRVLALLATELSSPYAAPIIWWS